MSLSSHCPHWVASSCVTSRSHLKWRTVTSEARSSSGTAPSTPSCPLWRNLAACYEDTPSALRRGLCGKGPRPPFSIFQQEPASLGSGSPAPHFVSYLLLLLLQTFISLNNKLKLLLPDFFFVVWGVINFLLFHFYSEKYNYTQTSRLKQ